MPDNDSSPHNLTPEQLSGLFPETWVHHQEISRPLRRKTFRLAPCVVIKRSRLNIPLSVWGELGKPAKVTCFFSGYDAFIVPSPDISLVIGKTWAYIPFQEKAKRFSPYLIKGVYPESRYKVERKGDIVYLRIIGSNFTSVSNKWLQHWKQQ